MALALLATLTSACAAVPSKVPGVCPHLKHYSNEVMDAAADELDALPHGSTLANIMMPDYGTMRDEVRACQAVTK